jgi:hypothetical protein
MAGSGTGTTVTPVSVVNISVDAWFDKVVSGAQLAPNVMIRRDIVEICRDICARTMLWTSELNPIDVVADQAEYSLPIAGADICGVDRAEFNGVNINPTSETALDEDTREVEEWRPRTIAIPERYFVNEKYEIRLVYIPDAALSAGLAVWAYLMPVPEATEVPLFLYNEFKDLVTLGTLGKLKMRPDMPWSDLQAGAGFMDVYEAKMPMAKQKKFTGFQRVKTRDIVRTRYHDF